MGEQATSPDNPADSTALPYTSSLIELLKFDALLIKDILVYFPLSLPGVLYKFWSRNPQHELSLYSWGNVHSLLLHGFLIPVQVLFLLSLFYALLFPVPAFAYVGGIVTFLVLNAYFCKLLNRDGKPYHSTTDLSGFPAFEDESWIFINGVSVGRHWLQANLNVLSATFGRRVVGIHNPTFGIIFDLLECIIQRDFNFVTDDIRRGYAEVKKNLLDPAKRKVVLVAHSQGGIEAGAILDWLLDDVPHDILDKLEIYTFGSAANHFNNPCRTSACSSSDGSQDAVGARGVVRHIEHYTNSGEFVSRFGILGFVRLPPNSSVKKGEDGQGWSMLSSTAESGTGARSDALYETPPPNKLPIGPDARDDELYKRQHNRFSGFLFNQNTPGHMMNQHYLATMFKLEPYTLPDGTTGERVADGNEFMDSPISAWDGEKEGQSWGWSWQWRRERRQSELDEKRHDVRNGSEGPDSRRHRLGRKGTALQELRKGRGKGSWSAMALKSGVDLLTALDHGADPPLRPRDVCRLWQYRNGMSPDDDGCV